MGDYRCPWLLGNFTQTKWENPGEKERTSTIVCVERGWCHCKGVQSWKQQLLEAGCQGAFKFSSYPLVITECLMAPKAALATCQGTIRRSSKPFCVRWEPGDAGLLACTPTPLPSSATNDSKLQNHSVNDGPLIQPWRVGLIVWRQNEPW